MSDRTTKTIKLYSVVGARPQFIKAWSICTALESLAEHLPFKIDHQILHTGQHYDVNMSDIFFQELRIPKPAFNLGVKEGTHGRQTGKMTMAIEEVLLEEAPDMLLVYGDTNSTLAGALAASKLHIPIAHIEAGLRSYNRKMPEEINRVLTDHQSSLLFVPAEYASENLRKEGIEENVVVTGDVMKDAALKFKEIARKKSEILDQLSLETEKYSLVTLHRAENISSKRILENFISILNDSVDEIGLVFSLHPNTKNKLSSFGLLEKFSAKIVLTDPIGYIDMIHLIDNAKLVITDSGGVQRESFFLGTPCLTARSETEWKEILNHSSYDLLDLNDPIVGKRKVREFLDLDVSGVEDRNSSAGEETVRAIVEFFKDRTH